MCDRTKAEVLARELAVQYWLGKLSECDGKPRYTNYTSMRDFCENTYTNFMDDANKILETLEKHK